MAANDRGRFITLEGIEGAGKSSNLAFIRDRLSAAGIELEQTREPGGTPLGEEVRTLLLSQRDGGMHSDTELLLMFAARAEHLNRRILPALEQGRWVLCDRFTDATFAYQGGGRGIADGRIETLEDWAQGALRPDLTVLLDLPVALGLERAGRRSTPDRFESEQAAFFERVRAHYLARAAAAPERFQVVDAGAPLHQVQQQIAAVLEDFMARG